jgi:glycosyltransferase involved in cell wall biosynthesis
MISRTPTVSVIIPVFNSAKTLEVCLASIAAQSFAPSEIIVSDDRSTDGSREIAARFACRVIVAPVNKGVSAARNAGVAASSGEVLFFADADMALAPGAIGEAVRALQEDPLCGFVHGITAAEPLFDDGGVEWCRTLHTYHARMRGAGITLTAHFAVAAMPRAVFADIGPLDERLRDYEDVEYSERMVGRHRVRVSDRVIAYHDEEESLRALLSEQFRRAQMMGPFAAAHRRRKGSLWQFSATAMLLAVLTVLTLPAALFSLPLLVLPVLSFLAFMLADPGLVRVVLRYKGWRFVPYFFAVQLALNVTIVAGAVTGMLKSLADRDFGRPATHLESQAR